MPVTLAPMTFDQTTGRARGRAHGEGWRAEIQELAAMREAMHGSRDLKRLEHDADPYLRALADWSPELAQELEGIAEGADVGVARVVLINHHGSLTQVGGEAGREAVEQAASSLGGTAIYLWGEHGATLGQTLDVDPALAPYLRIMRIVPRGGGRGGEGEGRDEIETICLTLTGCLGLCGLGPGLAVTVNGLHSVDRQTGVLGPAMVRGLLAAPTARAAWDLLRPAALASGHHYMLADGREFFGVECSGLDKMLTQLGPKVAHLHTDHCFDPVLRQRERVPPGSSTHDRLNTATTLYAQARPGTADGLWALLGSHDGAPRSICSHLAEVPGAACRLTTAARVVMEPTQGRLRVGLGCARGGESLSLLSTRSLAG